MKKWIIITVIVIIIISLGIGFCIYLYRINKQNDFIEQVEELSKENNRRIEEDNMLQATSNEEKTTPNTIFVIKKYYEKCGHTTSDYIDIPGDFINMTEDDIKDTCKEWQIKEFSSGQVVLFKYENGFCNEHYVLKEEDGVINVYIIDENGIETIKEKTDISTQYLPQTDRISLKNGIYIYGNEELYSALEDYE